MMMLCEKLKEERNDLESVSHRSIDYLTNSHPFNVIHFSLMVCACRYLRKNFLKSKANFSHQI